MIIASVSKYVYILTYCRRVPDINQYIIADRHALRLVVLFFAKVASLMRCFYSTQTTHNIFVLLLTFNHTVFRGRDELRELLTTGSGDSVRIAAAAARRAAELEVLLKTDADAFLAAADADAALLRAHASLLAASDATAHVEIHRHGAASINVGKSCCMFMPVSASFFASRAL